MHVRLDVAFHVAGSVGNGQLEGFLFFTELYHFHGILNCLSADCHLASLEWYGPYQQCYDALLEYTNPSENIRIEIMEISALHAELHNDGFLYDMLMLAKLLLIIGVDYTLSDGDMIRNRNGFEEDIDGVLYMFVGRALKSSGSFYYRTCYVRVKLKAKIRIMIQKLWVHDIHIDNGFLRKDESEQVVTTRLTFYDASTNVHGRQTFSLCRTVNPEDKRRIIGDMFVKDLKVIDRTANDLNVTWDNLLLGQVSLRLDLIGAASHMVSSRADAIKTHHNDSEMIRQLRIYGRVVEPLKDFISIKMNCIQPDTSRTQNIVLTSTVIFRLQVFTKYQADPTSYDSFTYKCLAVSCCN
ncbi:hypothetical protein OUZ56_023245 [Daphnia magna]|uniref:GMPS ATP-PPase domain-containing protein n=1 Tax=Daphnia magna TaxID=35525 RepID=A0ABR0AYT8_9CRUS|nr:hypothetical protein OUZ56_023245 [Daphnia magna]